MALSTAGLTFKRSASPSACRVWIPFSEKKSLKLLINFACSVDLPGKHLCLCQVSYVNKFESLCGSICPLAAMINL